jgi:site-specific recombinase XerD
MNGVYLKADELLAVLKAARARGPRDWAMILLAYRHGMRASEVCDLKVTDLDLKAESLSIHRLKGSLHTVQPLYRHKGQPLLDELNAIKAWLKERQDDGSDYVFLSQKGGRLSRVQFYRLFRAVAEAAGLPSDKQHPHVLKHTLGSHLAAGNVNLALIKQALGHRAISSTMVYVGVSDQQAAEAAQRAAMEMF